MFLAAELNEIANSERKSIVIDDEYPALLIRAGESYYCVEDVCTHDGQPLTDGKIENCQIECPRHGAKFDIKTGAALCMPANEPIKVFAVEVRADGVYVATEPS